MYLTRSSTAQVDVQLKGISSPVDDDSAANKQYVDNLFNQVAPVIVKVQLIDLGGSLFGSYNVKCYPAETGTASYSINFSVPPDRTGSLNYIKIIPPEQYAFTGLYQSSGIIAELGTDRQNFGIIQPDGTVALVGFPSDYSDKSWIITGTFTLEVA